MTATGAAFDRVLHALDQAGKRYKHDRPNHVQASCPGPRHQHGDRNPSLSITSIEGQALLHCHSGCDRQEVLDALGLTDADLFDDKRGAGYIYDDGRKVWRSPDKKFRQSGNTDGQRTRLYREAKIRQAVGDHQLVFLVEGEKDVHSIESLGEIATTAPMGATNIHKCDLSPLHGARVIAIVDRATGGEDVSGESWARYLRATLSPKADLEFAQAKVGKDVSDHIAAGFGLDQLVPYAFPVSQLLARVRTADWLGQQIIPPLRWIIRDLIPEGYSLLVGAPKIGKSWLSLAMALAVASGGYMFDKIFCGVARPVLLLALEDSDRRIQNRIRKLEGADPFWPPLLHYDTHVSPGDIIPQIQEWLIGLPRSAEPLVILDTIGKVIPPAFQGESGYSRDYRFSSQLQAITQQRPGMGLIGLHHDRKATTDDFVESISGTNGIAGAADTILVINRPRNEPEGVLSITGRDVEEEKYGLKLVDGRWSLMGDNLKEAARAARTVSATRNLGAKSAEIIEFIADHPEGVRAEDVADEFGIEQNNARSRLSTLAKSGRIAKAERGLYMTLANVASVASEKQRTQQMQGYIRDARGDELPIEDEWGT
jgi:hypothetical protein